MSVYDTHLLNPPYILILGYRQSHNHMPMDPYLVKQRLVMPSQSRLGFTINTVFKVCMYVGMYVGMYVCVCMYVCMYVCVYVATCHALSEQTGVHHQHSIQGIYYATMLLSFNLILLLNCLLILISYILTVFLTVF
jgi:hypothetical protein